MWTPLNIFTILIAAFLFAGCKGCFQKNISEVAPKELSDTLNINLPDSYFNIPVKYEVSKLEALLNQKISGKFFETTIDPLKEGKEELQLAFTKTKNIRVSVAGNQLLCSISLQADGIVLQSRLGKFLTKQVKPLSTVVHIELTTPVSLDRNWNIVTRFKIKSLRWVKEPVLQIGPIKKNLTEKIDAFLNSNESKLTAMLNDEINKAVLLQPVLAKVWSDLQKPLIIHKAEPQAWMKFLCDSIAGKIVLQPDNIICYTSVKAKMTMITDTVSLPIPMPLPPFKPLEKPDIQSDIYLYAFTSFDEINEELNSKFGGREFTAKGYNIIIEKIRAYASDKGLSVEVQTKKDVNGTVVASGKLEFDAATQKIAILNFDYAMNSDNTMLNAGDQYLHSFIKDSIGSKLTLNLDTLIVKVPQLAENAISKGRTGNTIDLRFDSLVIKNCEILMGMKRVHFKIHASAAAGIEIKNINAGKRLKIKTKAEKK